MWDTGSAKLHRGPNYCQINFVEFPLEVLVKPEGSQEPRRIIYHIPIDPAFTIRAVDFFFGHDRGDRFEMDCSIYGADDWFIARRIEESEVTNREASKLVPLPLPVRTKHLTIYTTCRVTGESLIEQREHGSHAKHPGWRGVFDMNLILIGSTL